MVCVNISKFPNCLVTCNITRDVHKPTHLHGHILDLVLTPTVPSVVFNVRVLGIILDHTLGHGTAQFYQSFCTKVKPSYLSEVSQDKDAESKV